MIHRPAFAAEEHVQAPVAVRHAGLRQLAQPLPERLLRGHHAHVAHTRAGNTPPASHTVRSETAFASCTQRTHVRRCAGLTIFFSQEILQDGLVETQVRDELFELPVFFPELPQLQVFWGPKLPELLPPPKERLLRDLELATDYHDGRATLGLPQRLGDLLRAVLAGPQLLSSSAHSRGLGQPLQYRNFVSPAGSGFGVQTRQDLLRA